MSLIRRLGRLGTEYNRHAGFARDGLRSTSAGCNVQQAGQLASDNALRENKHMTEESVKQKISDTIENLITLKIVTSVGAGETGQRMETQINLVAGDIQNSIDREFVTGDLKELRTFHEAQVLKGQQIIKDNIEATKALATLVRDWFSKT